MRPEHKDTEELASLRERLREAEDLLDAIRHGHVDALVTDESEGQTVTLLREGEELYRLTVDTMIEGALTLDCDATILHVNSQMASLVDTPKETLVGSSILNWAATEDRDALKQLLQHASAAVSRCRIRVQRSGGAGIPVMVAVRRNEGASAYLIMVVTDLSSLVSAEAERQQLANIVNDANEGIFSQSLEGRITTWNAAAEHIFGYAAGEIIGKPADHLYPKREKRIMNALLARAKKGDIVEQELVQGVNKGGQRLDLAVSLSPIMGADGELSGISSFVHDLRTQRDAEKALQVSEQRMTSMLGSLEMLAVITDARGIVTYCNAFAAQVLGLPAEKVTGHDWLTRFVPFSERAEAKQTFKQLRGKLCVTAHEERAIQTCRGTQRLVRWDHTALFDASRRTQGIVSIGTDITEFRRASSELQASELRFRKLIENASDVIAVIRADGRVKFISPAVKTVLGYSPDEVVGQAYQDYLHPDDQVEAKKELLRLVGQAEATFQVRRRYRHRDGQWRMMEILGSSQIDTPGVEGIVVTMRDITWRQEAEERLSLLRTLIDNSGDALYVIDPQTLRLLDVNLRACSDLGYSQEELLRMSINDIDLMDQDKINALRNTLRNEGQLIFETVHTCKDGSSFPVEVSAHYIELDRAYVLATGRDISERKRVTEELEHSRGFLEKVLNLIPVRVFWKDRELVYQGCNAGFAADIGQDRPDDVVGLTDTDMPWSNQAERIGSRERAILRTGRARMLIEETLDFKSGGCRTLLTSRQPWVDARGEVQGILGTYQDITEHKLATESLRVRMRHQRCLFDLAKLSGEEHDTAASLLATAAQCLGCALGEDARGVRIVFGKHEVSTPSYRQKDPQFDFKLRFDLRSAGQIQVSFQADAVLDEAEQDMLQVAARILSQAMSIRRHRKQLEKSEETFRTLFESSRDAILTAFPPDWTLSTFNPAACDLFQIPAEQFRRLSAANLSPSCQPDGQDSAEKAMCLLKTALDQGFALFDWEFKKSDDACFLGSVQLTRIVMDDRTGVQASIRDISELRTHQLELERVNRALRTLDAGNSAVLHAESEQDLLQQMCDAIVQSGGYCLAWVGQESPESNELQPLCSSGLDLEVIKDWRKSLSFKERKNDPLRACIASQKLILDAAISKDSKVDVLSEFARRHGYHAYIALPLISGRQNFGVLSIFTTDTGVFDSGERALLEELAGELAFGIDALRTRRKHDESMERLTRGLDSTVASLAMTVELRDPYTAGHQHRVAKIAEALARVMRLAEERINGLKLAAGIHDIGKICVPIEILAKPGRLSPLERALVEEHAQAGYDIIKGIEFPWPVADIIHQHHERLDGSGYPQGLKADDILLEARILAVADVVESMASHRPYRPSLGLNVTLETLKEGAGTLFDPEVVKACQKLIQEDGFELPR